MDDVRDTTRSEALARAKQLFDKLDVDNPQHACVLIMYDHNEESFRMVAINSDTLMSAALLAMALQAMNNAEEAVQLREEGKLN